MRKYRSATAAAALALLWLASATSAQAQSAEQYAFDLPAETLSQALRDVAVRTGRNVIAPADLIGTQQTPPLSGTFTAEQAVARLLAGTGLRYRLVEGMLVVERSPFANRESAEGGSSAEDIVVTGTHVRGAPPTSPVITLTRRQIDQLAPASVEELMRSVPQNVDSGVAPESFNTGADPDITDHGAGINLRGLGQLGNMALQPLRHQRVDKWDHLRAGQRRFAGVLGVPASTASAPASSSRLLRMTSCGDREASPTILRGVARASARKRRGK